jgi:putative zinc finger/helix-turn-helix YgiT family protein
MTEFKSPLSSTPLGDQENGSSCPECGSGPVKSLPHVQTFPYGQGSDFVELSATVPLRVCTQCGFEYLDDAAELLRHEAVCRHLDVLTPSEIRAIRESYSLSRTRFARITKLGEATVARWERGEVIQNAALDEYLRLISIPANFSAVRRRSEGGITADGGSSSIAPIVTPMAHAVPADTDRQSPTRFRSVCARDFHVEQGAFDLRKAS